MRATDPIDAGSEEVAFELERLRRDGDRGLEVRGRWSGIRGRRFVRPTLTLRIDGTKHRLLADLEHKPWAAEDGEEWVALFSPAPPPGKADRIELSVAPDITVALSTPGSRTSAAKAKRPSNGAGAQPPVRRRSEAQRARPAAGEERAKTPDLVRELETAAAERARLAAERDALRVEREELRVERDALVVEREGMRRQHARARKRVAELQNQLKALEASANAGVAEARGMLETQRAESTRLRAALEARETEAGDHGRMARELETVVAERDRLAQQVRAAREVRGEVAPARRALPARSGRRAPVWVPRVFALTAILAFVLAFASAAHLI